MFFLIYFPVNNLSFEQFNACINEEKTPCV